MDGRFLSAEQFQRLLDERVRPFEPRYGTAETFALHTGHVKNEAWKQSMIRMGRALEAAEAAR